MSRKFLVNLELWQALNASLARHATQLVWVRGHAGQVKNEFANDLAVRAAKEQITSDGIIAATFDPWLEAERAKGRYQDDDPDATFAALEARVAGGETLPLALEEKRR